MSADDILHDIYYDPVSGFSGAVQLRRRAKEKGHDLKPKTIRQWLAKQDVEQQHAKPERIKTFARIMSSKVGDLHQYDIMNMDGTWRQKKGRKTFRYLLTGIDVHSRYATAVPLAKRDSATAKQAILQIWKKLGQPNRVEVDNGTEFKGEVAKLLKSKRIRVRYGDVGIHRQQAIIERWHRTIEQKMIRYMRTKGAGRWLEALDKLIDNYNSSYHSTLRGKPVDVFKGRKKPAELPPRKSGCIKAPLKVGTWVRYQYDAPEGATHRRAYDAVWSSELAIITAVVGDPGTPQLYYLTTEDSEEIKRPYYRCEIKPYKKIDKVKARSLE